jgi:riboflavin-specific deaminase-like protein
VALQRIYPRPGQTTPEDLISRLDLGSRAHVDRPYLVANMVASLDGKATAHGQTRALSSEVDRTLFHQLRTQADGLLVGAGTVRAERYGRATKSEELRAKREREGLAPEPLTVIVSARLDLSPELPLLQATGAPVVIATGADHELEGVAAEVTYLRTGEDLPLMLARLREDHGVRSLLCEGGPTLNSHLLAAGLVDELFLSVSPQVLGGADALTIVAGRVLGEPLGAELVWLCEAGGELFGRWRLRRG